jgi:hypothetical protein
MDRLVKSLVMERKIKAKKVSAWIRRELKSQSEFAFGPEPFRLVGEPLPFVEPVVVEVPAATVQAELF